MSDTDRTVAAEAKTAATEFLAGFRSFRDETSRRIAEMGTRIDALDRKSVELRRPALSTTAELKAPHAKAMAAYVRRGDDEPLRSLHVETKALNTQVEAEGGFLVDPKTSEMIDTILRSGGSIRSLARVVQVEAGVFDVLVDHTDMGAGWVDELATVGETEAPLVDRISITLHELSAAPTASQRILDDAAFDVEAWLAERIADRFLRAEAAAFVSGNGIGKPKGFLAKPAVENGSWAWGSIGYIATGSSGDFDPNDPADALIEMVYALPAEYRAGAAFVMNSKTAGEVRKMKDAQGRFLWAEGLHAAQPALLCGYPVLVAEDMPDIDTDAHAIAFGNFEKGYTIAERPDLRVLRDPYSAKPNVMFYATKRIGGDVTDYAAIKTLKFGTA
jgi:HK97 family phage major capsid protein